MHAFDLTCRNQLQDRHGFLEKSKRAKEENKRDIFLFFSFFLLSLFSFFFLEGERQEGKNELGSYMGE